jgi:hypothetical protein
MLSTRKARAVAYSTKDFLARQRGACWEAGGSHLTAGRNTRIAGAARSGGA